MLTGDEAVDVLSNSDTQESLMNLGIITDEFVAGMRTVSVTYDLYRD